MKRIKAACLCQTLHFTLKEDVDHTLALEIVADEVARYKQGLDRNRTRYKILEETTQPDGSVVLRIVKQYNQCPVGKYLDMN